MVYNWIGIPQQSQQEVYFQYKELYVIQINVLHALEALKMNVVRNFQKKKWIYISEGEFDLEFAA